MSSELGPAGKRAMKALGAMLGILDVKQAPGVLKTDELVPVIAADAGWAAYERVTLWGFGVIPAGTGVLDLKFCGEPDEPTDPVLLQESTAYELLILGFQIKVNWSASGAAAWAGKYVDVALYRNDGNDYPNVGEVRMGYKVSVAQPVFNVGPDMFIDIESDGPASVTLCQVPFWIPAGTTAGISIAANDGSTFPAGGALDTAYTFSAMGVKVPKGVKPPFVP